MKSTISERNQMLAMRVFFILGLILSFIIPSSAQAIQQTDRLLIGLNSYAPGDEVIELRTETGKTIYLAPGRYAVDTSLAAVHYKDNYSDSKEQWKDIDLTIVNGQITKAPYILTINNTNKTVTVQDKKTGDIVIVSVTMVPTGKLSDFTMPVTARNTGIRIELPHDSDMSISKSKPVTSIKIKEQSDADKLLPVMQRAGFIDIDNKTATTFSRKANSTLDLDISANADDATVYWTGAAWAILDDGYTRIGNYTAGYTKLGDGLRWTNVTVPSGATIDTAYVVFKDASLGLGTGTTCKASVCGDLESDAAAFGTVANFQSRRGTDAGGANNNLRTTAEVAWNPVNAWSPAEEGADTTTPEIKTVVQEIIDQGTWASGNHLALFVDDYDGLSTAGAWRAGIARNASATDCPRLHIEYTTGPTVTTQAGSSVEATTATGNGNLTDDSGLTITERGICYSSINNPPTTADSTSAAAGVGEGAYTAALTSLSTGTTYYLRAYVETDEPATYYGSTVTILTKPAAPTNVAATDGTDTAKVVITWTKSTGANQYHVWRDATDLGAAGDVATADDSGADAPVITAGTVTATDGTSTTEVTLSLAGESVANGTTHTYKVVASNATGNSADSATDTGYRGHGAITYQWQVSAADSDAAYGDIGGATTDPYSYTSAPAPVITPGTASASDATSSTFSTLTVTGHSAANGGTRYYKCVVSATGAANATTAYNTGYRGITTLTYAWQRSAGDADNTFGALAGATTNPYNDLTAVVTPDGRYYYCIISMTGAANADTTHDRGNRTAFAAPTVITGACTGYYGTSAILNGSITAPGDDVPTIRGFDYGTTTSYGVSSVTTLLTGYGNAAYSATITGLTPSTQYHYRAKAYNGAWGYGADSIFSTTGSPAIEYYFQTTADNQTNIYGVNWAEQTFTTDNVTPKSVTSIRLLLNRVGSPGYVTVSLRDTSDNVSTGIDLVSGILNGTGFSTSATWYQFTMETEKSLKIDTQYAITVSAPGGDAANYIQWKFVNAGGYTGGIGATSVNSGLTWTQRTWDYNFEVWGNSSMTIEDVKIFQSFKSTGDWLAVVRYINTTAPYYDTYDVKRYFAIQFTNATGTVLASAALPAWGNKVGNIYMSAAQVAGLDWGGDYRVRIHGLFTGNPYFEYTLQSTDWAGEDLAQLDSWVLSSAAVMSTYYNTTMTTYIASRGEVLNATGGAIFSSGINGLGNERPDLFQINTASTTYNPNITPQTYRLAVSDWETNWGPDGVIMLNRIGSIIGMGGNFIASIFFVIIMIGLALFAFPAGHSTAANILCVPALIIGIFFGIDLIFLGILGIFAAFLLIKNLWLDK